MANNVQKITGIAYWAKVLGAPTPSYDKEKRHWTIDICVDDAVLAVLKEHKLVKTIKNKFDDRGPYIQFQRLEFKKKTGAPNKPITVNGPDGKPWDQTVLIGNGSKVEVIFSVFEVPTFGNNPAHNSVAILEVKVLEHVPYVKPEKAQSSAVAQADASWKGDVV